VPPPVVDGARVGDCGFVPVPVRMIVCGLLGSLSVMVMVPVRVPVAVGVKVTVIVHGYPCMVRPQVVVSLKSPVIPMCVREMAPAWGLVFVSVTVWPVLVVPTA